MRFLKYIILCVAVISTFMACKDNEDDWSKDYDINLPRPIIDSLSSKTDTVEKTITIIGKNFRKISGVSIAGSYDCSIISVDTTDKNKNKIKVKIPRNAITGSFYVNNSYSQTVISSFTFTPVYLNANVTEFPDTIRRGSSFIMKGNNMDMISKVKVAGVAATIKSASLNKITISVADINLYEISTASIEIATKTNQVISSPKSYPIGKALKTYTPSLSYLLADFDSLDVADYTLSADGSKDSPNRTVSFNGNGVKGIGRCLSTIGTAKVASGEGHYFKFICNNNAKGFDLSGFKKPYLTFLVNTKGKKGYMMVAPTQNGNSDWNGWGFFVGNDKYPKDKYYIQTDGWEWRSYDLSYFSSINWSGTLDNIQFLVSPNQVTVGEDFEFHIDQIMITDGPLNPVTVADFETGSCPVTNAASGITASLDGQSGSSDNYEGNHYLTVKGASTNWSDAGSFKVDGVKINPDDNACYFNYLLNTGKAKGYFQLAFTQNGTTKVKHAVKGTAVKEYADNYVFESTNNTWQWRSYPIDIRNPEWNWESDPSKSIDFTQPFTVEIGFKGGNNNLGDPYETNVDCIMFSNTPLDAIKSVGYKK